MRPGKQMPIEVIVVDDIARFPLHVWRYLSRSIVYGIGGVQDDGERKPQDNQLAALLQKDGLWDATRNVVVRWVPIRQGDVEEARWHEALDARAKASRIGSRIFVLDVRGPYSSSGADYDLRGALEILDNRGVEYTEGERENSRSIWLVSSYAIGAREYRDRGLATPVRLPIHSKTAETLEALTKQVEERIKAGPEETGRSVRQYVEDRRRLPSRRTEATTRGADSQIHVLVTGAGFEMCADDPIATLGMPSTKQLMERCFDLHYPASGPENKKYFSGKKWQLPVRQGDQNSPAVRGSAGKDKNLDAYWDYLLANPAHPEDDPPKSDPNTSPSAIKLDVLAQELELRQSFRQAFVEHDWGFMNATLDAVRLPWDAWLTTNYTRFADRGIALAKAALGDEAERCGRWRVVSTSNEAKGLLKETLHGGDRSESFKDRILFKLHGDLGHVSTMALCHHDKDVSTPLSVVIDSLHWVYVAAEQYLTRLIEHRWRGRRDDDGLVHWHIVGHSLYDMLLWRKMEQVMRRTGVNRHRIVVVNYDDEEALEIKKVIEERLTDTASSPSGKSRPVSPIVPAVYRDQNARSWLAFLAREYGRTTPGVLRRSDDESFLERA